MVKIGNDWDELLEDEWQKEYYRNLRIKLYNEYKTKKVYPDMYDIFNALKYTPYKECKVVILGQDPYHGFGQAHGLSFSVKKGVKLPPSLQNIYKEIKDDLGVEMSASGDLTCWAKQGVLLLNTSLTVKEGSPNSHVSLGWHILTDRIIELLNDRKAPIVFLLWGANAGNKQTLITNPRHLILKAPHPSPLSANRGFFGCKHFSKTNDFLKANGEKPIDWSVPD